MFDYIHIQSMAFVTSIFRLVENKFLIGIVESVISHREVLFNPTVSQKLNYSQKSLPLASEKLFSLSFDYRLGSESNLASDLVFVVSLCAI